MTAIRRQGDGFRLATKTATEAREYRVKKIVLATGGTERPRKMGVKGEDLPHVSHYFADPHQYFQRKVLIVGGRNSAVEAALRAHYAGASVSLCYRREGMDQKSIKYWLWPEINGLIQAERIRGYFSHKVVEIGADHVTLESATGERKQVAADFVLLLIGYEADMTLCRMAGVDLVGGEESPRFDPATMQTNVPGVYVAGTAVAGTQQKYALFIENCHVHVERIIASLLGNSPPAAPAPFERPES